MNYSLRTKLSSRLQIPFSLSACLVCRSKRVYRLRVYRLSYSLILAGFIVVISVTGCDRQTFPLGRAPERVTTFTLQHEKPEPVIYSFTPDRNVPGLNNTASTIKK